jgi:hypothetical protein
MGKVYLWIILSLKFTFDILFCFIKSIFNIIEQGLMNTYKTLYMQNTIWSLLQDDIHNMDKLINITLCMSCDKTNVLLTIY